MSRATSAVDMWPRIGPPCRAQAVASFASAIRAPAPRRRRPGRGTAGKTGERLLEGVEAPQRGAAGDPARVEPDDVEAGPQLQRQERAPTRAKSTPEPPGPPGLRNSEPIRRLGSAAGRRSDLQVDPRAVRLVVVERYGSLGALEAALTRDPVQAGGRTGLWRGPAGRGPGGLGGARAEGRGRHGEGKGDGRERRTPGQTSEHASPAQRGGGEPLGECRERKGDGRAGPRRDINASRQHTG